MKLHVYGEGVLALVLAAGLSESGNQVVLFGKLDAHQKEKGLSAWLTQQLESKRLTTQPLDYSRVHESADIHFIALDSEGCGEAQALVAAIDRQEAGQSSMLVFCSSFSLGKARSLGESTGLPWAVNPDFGSEGQLIANYLRPNRIILGSDYPQVIERLRVLYAPRNRLQDVIQVMSPESAELTKYGTNVMLATRVSLMNELAQAAECLGADIEDVRRGMGSDTRIGFSYLYPGVGFGGSSLMQDLERTQALFDRAGVQSDLIRSVMAMNEVQKDLLFRKVWRVFTGDLTGKSFALWGLSYKPETPSIKNAPALRLLQSFLSQGARVKVFDPMAMATLKAHAQAQFPQAWQDLIVYADSAMEALEEVEALLVVTEWKSFWSPDFDGMKAVMKAPRIFDGRNLYNPAYLREKGFEYWGVGR
jgi:UDPglucose 6-dehydrogenase